MMNLLRLVMSGQSRLDVNYSGVEDVLTALG